VVPVTKAAEVEVRSGGVWRTMPRTTRRRAACDAGRFRVEGLGLRVGLRV